MSWVIFLSARDRVSETPQPPPRQPEFTTVVNCLIASVVGATRRIRWDTGPSGLVFDLWVLPLRARVFLAADKKTYLGTVRISIAGRPRVNGQGIARSR